MGQIKLLVVDDSLFMQRILQDILQSDQQISVIGTARDGEEALSKIASLHPDVVTMDIEMPRMDGLTAVQRIMEKNPVPIVMVSALTQREAQLTLNALEIEVWLNSFIRGDVTRTTPLFSLYDQI